MWNISISGETTLRDIAVDGALIVFEPDPDWQWQNWNGAMEMNVGSTGIQIQGKNVALAEDFRNLGQRLTTRPYVAKGFDDSPGTVTTATVLVEETTLAMFFDSNGRRIANISTSGTFVVGCSPSFKSGEPPIPDPLAQRKTGRWSVKDAGQTIASSE